MDTQSPPTVELTPAPGDVLLSGEALPFPSAILTGFRKSRYGPQFEPYIDFGKIQNLLEFLEHVVLCERLIVPVPRFARRTERLINGRRTWIDYALFRAAGDLDYTSQRLADRLEASGVLAHAEVQVGEPTADAVVSKLLPRSKWMQGRFAQYMAIEPVSERTDRLASAQARMARFIGAPLHIAEAAAATGVPFILGRHESKEISGYESEALRVRRSVTQLLLASLNRGARREIEKLAELGPTSVFPETPIARLIVQNASTPDGLVDAALALRTDFASFRQAMAQIESDLVRESQSISVRLKRLREIDRLAESLWNEKKTDLRTSAISVSEALAAIPEATAAPSTNSIGALTSKLLALPVEQLIDVYRRRKVRLLIKAKRSFLKGSDATLKLASIFGVSEDIARRSRTLARPALTKRYAEANPEFAASYYGTSASRSNSVDETED